MACFAKKKRKFVITIFRKETKKKTLNDIGALKAHNQIRKGYTI